MPLPLLVPIILATIVGGGTILALAGAFRDKKVLIYGMKASGKTTFINYCTNSNFSDFMDAFGEYKPTQNIGEEKQLSEEWSRWVGAWKLTDTPGQLVANQDILALEKKIEEADTVLYFCRADELYNPATRKKTLRTIRSNISQYRNILKKDGKNKLVLVATHYDKISHNPFEEIQIELNNDDDYIRIMNNEVKPLCKGFFVVSFMPEYINGYTKTILKAMVS